MTTATLDPANASAVGDALIAHLRERLGSDTLAFAEAPAPLGRGFASFIYAFRLDGAGLKDAWRAPLVLRVLPDLAAGPVLDREEAVQRFVGERGYPVLSPLVTEATGAALGLPFMIVPRAMGGTMLDRVGRNPLSVPRLLAAMGEVHVALHRVAVDGCPLPYEAPLVDRRIADWHARIDSAGSDELRRGLAWLEDQAPRVRHEEPAICHNDFHPLNLLIGDDGRLIVIDWSDAAIGDRHADVARTVTLLWFAQIAATSVIERLALRAARGYMRQRYLAAYQRQLPVDPVRLRYWEAASAFNAWLQLVELQVRGEDAPEAQLEMVQRLKEGTLLDQVRHHFWSCAT